MTNMAQAVAAEPLVEPGQVKKAVQALLAYNKTKRNADALLLNENENINLMVTVWKIPKEDKVIRISLPHGIRSETTEVCLFTKDEPNMTSEQTEKFYKALLSKHSIKNVSQVIPYKILKKEYKPYEAKRRLLSAHDLFLADERIRRLLPSHLGKHFYKAKRAPLSVNLKARNLAAELNRFIQGTILSINSRGCCYATRVGHTGMKAEELIENILRVIEVMAEKLPEKWKNVKILHLKTQTSIALPIFTSSLCDVQKLDEQAAVAPNQKEQKQEKKSKANLKDSAETSATEVTKKTHNAPVPIKRGKKEKGRTVVPAEHSEDNVPQLISIQEESLELQKMSPPPEKEVKVKSGAESSPGKKKRSLVQETPQHKHTVDEEEVVEHHIPSKQKKVAVHKILKSEVKVSGPSPAKNRRKRTAGTPAAKVAGAPKSKKLIRSARKAPNTPKLKQKEMKVPQSA